VNIWCGIIGNLLIKLCELEDHLTDKHYQHFLQEKVPQLFEDVLLEVRQM
jgi:hypothetical protein